MIILHLCSISVLICGTNLHICSVILFLGSVLMLHGSVNILYSSMHEGAADSLASVGGVDDDVLYPELAAGQGVAAGQGQHAGQLSVTIFRNEQPEGVAGEQFSQTCISECRSVW